MKKLNEMLINLDPSIQEQITKMGGEIDAQIIMAGKFHTKDDNGELKPNKELITIYKNIFDAKAKLSNEYDKMLEQFKNMKEKRDLISKFLDEVEQRFKKQYFVEMGDRVETVVEVAGIETTKMVEKPSIPGMTIRKTNKVEYPETFPTTVKVQVGDKVEEVSIVRQELDKTKVKKLQKEFGGVYEQLGVKEIESISVSINPDKLVQNILEVKDEQ